jgi:integrase
MSIVRHRKQNLLTELSLKSKKPPGRYSDGNGLYLLVRKGGSRQWVFLFRKDGKLREMGLGGAKDVTLPKARELRDEARAALATGTDPLEARRQAGQATAATPTFGAFALGLVERIESEFSNAKHRAEWRATLEAHCKPIWNVQIDRVDTVGVLSCLTPIWQAIPETASRVRGRIERVLSAARAEGYRTGENPAAWRGHLDATLPKRAKLDRGHHAALPYGDMARFMADLRAIPTASAKALELTILTAARTGEMLNAKWDEISEVEIKIGEGDRATTKKIWAWTVPANRMKSRKEHRVPLSGRALAILDEVRAARTVSPFIFPGQRRGKPLSHFAMLMILDRMGRADITCHGFRSTFSDWASEVSSFSGETREAALAHVIGNRAEAAYRRGDALEKRRLMMGAWAQWCEPKAANVIAFTRPA